MKEFCFEGKYMACAFLQSRSCELNCTVISLNRNSIEKQKDAIEEVLGYIYSFFYFFIFFIPPFLFDPDQILSVLLDIELISQKVIVFSV